MARIVKLQLSFFTRPVFQYRNQRSVRNKILHRPATGPRQPGAAYGRFNHQVFVVERKLSMRIDHDFFACAFEFPRV